MTINGQSQSRTIIDAQGADRIFVIPGSVSVTLQNMTIKNGQAFSNGGWFIVSGNGQDAGAIYNVGSLQINHCTLSGNSAGDGEYSTLSIGGIGGSGGAIFNSGTLTINNSIFTNNRAGDGGGSGWLVGGNGGSGGAIYNTGTLYITNSIMKSNRAGYGGHGWISGGIDGQGGVIYSTGLLHITSSMIENNTAGDYRCGGVATDGGTAEVHFNVIVDNTNGEVAAYSGTVNATLNYWGTYDKPGGVGTYVNVDPWLLFIIPYLNDEIDYGDNLWFMASLTFDSNGVIHDPANGHVMDGLQIGLETLWGNVAPSINTTLNGVVGGTYLAIGNSPVPQTTVIYAILNDYPMAFAYSVPIRIIMPPNVIYNNINNSSSQNVNTPIISAESKINTLSRTIRMQETGLPVNYLILAILTLFGGLFLPKRK